MVGGSSPSRTTWNSDWEGSLRLCRGIEPRIDWYHPPAEPGAICDAMEEPQPTSLETINRRVLAPLVIFAAVSALFFQQFIMGSDMFWHLAAGRNIWETGTVPSTDVFSHSFAGKEWLNHEWLWDVIHWGICDSLGLDAVAWFTIGLYVVIFSLLFLEAYRTTGSMFAAGVSVWIATLSAHWFLDIRPHVFSLIFTALVLATRHVRWIHWTWPIIIILWTNLHAGFVFGMGLVGLMVLVKTIEDSLEAQELQIPWEQWVAVALSLLAWLVNPFGWHLIKYPLEYLKGDTVYKGLVEWHKPLFGLDPQYFEGAFWWMVILALIGAYCYRSYTPIWLVLAVLAVAVVNSLVSDRIVADRKAFLEAMERPTTLYFPVFMFLAIFFGDKKCRYLTALNAVTMLMACESRRFIPLFCVTATPLAALGVLYLRDRLAGWVPQVKSPAAGLAATLGGLAVAIFYWSHFHIGEGLARDWTIGDRYPEEEVVWINEVKPGERVFNRYNWGGYLMLYAPGYKTIFDGRANTLYDDEMYNLFYKGFMNGIFTSEQLALYPTDFVLVESERLSRKLEQTSPPWKRIHNGRGKILLPPDSPLLETDFPTIEELLPDGISAQLSRARVARTTGKLDEAIEILEDLVEPYYYEPNVHYLLASTYADKGELDKVKEVLGRARSLNPRRAIGYWGHESRIFYGAGDLEHAYYTYKKCITGGPFGSEIHRYNHLMRLRKLEKEMERAKVREQRGF